MKRTITLLLLIFVSYCIFAQTQVTYVKTPKGGDVTDAWELGDGWNSTQKAALSDSITQNYPYATEVNPPSATYHYNCHSFAWYRSEGGTGNVWIGWESENGEDIYWGDTSYIEVSTLNEASKISYAGDHSAIKLSGTNCRSKWGPWPLVDHPVGYGPYTYDMSNRTYYKLANPTISGSTSTLCDNVERTFSESAFTDIDLDYDWDHTSQLDEISDDDESTYTVEGTSLSGQGTVSLTITTPSGATATASKEMWVNTFESTVVTGQAAVCPDELYTYTAQVPGGHDSEYDYDWTYPSNWIPQAEMANWIRLKTAMYDPDYGTVRVSITNECGASGYSGITVYPGYCGRSYAIILSPNPTTRETTLSIESTSDSEELSLKSASTNPDFDENEEWELEIYSDMQMLKEKKIKLKGKSTKIKTHGWKEGVYIVRVKYKNEILTEKLVIK